MNPFVTTSYRGPEYFIDRELESEQLIDAIENERNLTLFSHRRFGKTMLLQHVFARLDHRNYTTLFVDLFATRNLVHFAQKLSGVLYEKKILHQNRLVKILGSLGASITFDPVTGSPQINFNITERSSILRSLPELFRLISDSGKQVVIAMDEFQEVAGYEEDYAEATLRSIMQESPGIVFIFSGSRKTLMQEIFTGSNRPFFQATQMMELREIDQEVYRSEVCRILDRHHKKHDPGVIDRVLEETYCHTGFSHMVFSRLFSESNDTIEPALFEQVWSDILENHKSMAREQEYLLPELQWKTLIAIAREGHVRSPQGKDFIQKYHLSVPSSMSRAVSALLNKGLIIDSGEKGLRVYNVFIEKNLRLMPLT